VGPFYMRRTRTAEFKHTCFGGGVGGYNEGMGEGTRNRYYSEMGKEGR